MVALDLSATFDTVNRKILLEVFNNTTEVELHYNGSIIPSKQTISGAN